MRNMLIHSAFFLGKKVYVVSLMEGFLKLDFNKSYGKNYMIPQEKSNNDNYCICSL